MGSDPHTFVVGVISDTHGTIDPRALDVFAQAHVDHIIHAGDIGSVRVLVELEALAPLTAVLGNMDSSHLGIRVRPQATLVLGGVRFAVVHEPANLHMEVLPKDTRVCITGHTHRARIRVAHGRLELNPGSASQPRGQLPASVAIVTIN
ncbi:MAG: metallophosphoesterase family protein, partial [Actinomycetota bacterium]|nr:metallophosphoesterase family protein [Actinomycetota bacterium]